MTLTVEDLKQLATLVTRGEDGVHFMTRYDTDWLLSMEEAGYIVISRPVHEPTGLAYSEEYWSVQVVADLGDDVQETVAVLEVLLRHDEGAYGHDALGIAREWALSGFDAVAVEHWLDAGVCDADHATALAQAGYTPATLPAFSGRATDNDVARAVEARAGE